MLKTISLLALVILLICFQNSVAEAQSGQEGDVDNDSDVDAYDKQMLRSNFGTYFQNADFNQNGTVDIFDFNIVSDNFGSLVQPPSPTPTVGDDGEEDPMIVWDGIATDPTQGMSAWKIPESCSRDGESTNCSGIDRLSVVSDSTYGKVYQAAMTSGDEYRGSSRAEFSVPAHDNGQRVAYMLNGEEYYIGYRSKVNYGFDSLGDGDSNSGNLMQLKGRMSCGGPAIGLTIKNGRLTLRRETQDGSSGIIWNGPTFSNIEGKWFDLVIHVKYSTNDTVGYLEIWHNGVQQLNESGGPKFYDQTICFTNDEVYLKLGIYRNDRYNKNGVFDYHWIHEPRIGYSYQAVAPRGNRPSSQ